MANNTRLIKCLLVSGVTNGALVCVVGSSQLLHPVSVVEVLRPVPLASYKPQALIAKPRVKRVISVSPTTSQQHTPASKRENGASTKSTKNGLSPTPSGTTTTNHTSDQAPELKPTSNYAGLRQQTSLTAQIRRLGVQQASDTSRRVAQSDNGSEHSSQSREKAERPKGDQPKSENKSGAGKAETIRDEAKSSSNNRDSQGSGQVQGRLTGTQMDTPSPRQAGGNAKQRRKTDATSARGSSVDTTARDTATTQEANARTRRTLSSSTQRGTTRGLTDHGGIGTASKGANTETPIGSPVSSNPQSVLGHPNSSIHPGINAPKIKMAANASTPQNESSAKTEGELRDKARLASASPTMPKAGDNDEPTEDNTSTEVKSSTTTAAGKRAASLKTAGTTPKPADTSRLTPKPWQLKPGQKLVLPKTIDVKLLEKMANMPVAPVTLSAAQREQIRKMLEGQPLIRVKNLDRNLLAKLVDAAKKAEDTAPADNADDWVPDGEQKPKSPARTPRKNTGPSNQTQKDRLHVAALPTDTNSPFRYRPWSASYSKHYEELALASDEPKKVAMGSDSNSTESANSLQSDNAATNDTGKSIPLKGTDKTNGAMGAGGAPSATNNKAGLTGSAPSSGDSGKPGQSNDAGPVGGSAGSSSPSNNGSKSEQPGGAGPISNSPGGNGGKPGQPGGGSPIGGSDSGNSGKPGQLGGAGLIGNPGNNDGGKPGQPAGAGPIGGSGSGNGSKAGQPNGAGPVSGSSGGNGGKLGQLGGAGPIGGSGSGGKAGQPGGAGPIGGSSGGNGNGRSNGAPGNGMPGPVSGTGSGGNGKSGTGQPGSTGAAGGQVSGGGTGGTGGVPDTQGMEAGDDFGFGLLEGEGGYETTDLDASGGKKTKTDSRLNRGDLANVTTTSTPQTPDLPPHNHHLQKGIPGALVLPPLPPLGTEGGTDPDLKPIEHSHTRHVFVAAALDTPSLRPHARPEQPVTKAAPSRQPQPQPVARPRFIAVPPRPQGVPDVIPALSLGSMSTRGTVAIAQSERVQLPLGTIADSLVTSERQGQSAAPPGPINLSPAVGPAVGTVRPRATVRRVQQTVSRIVSSLFSKAHQTTQVAVEKSELMVQVQAPMQEQKARPLSKSHNSRGTEEGSLNPLPPIPLPDSDSEIGDGSGLKGEYYLGINFDQYQFTRADRNLDLFWGADASPSSKLPPGGSWSCRWTGKLQPPYSEDYTLYAVADDGVRVWIDGRLVIDHWAWAPKLLEYAVKLPLDKNRQYDVRVDFFNTDGPAAIGLYWESSHQTKEFIPEECLFYPLPEPDNSLQKYDLPR